MLFKLMLVLVLNNGMEEVSVIDYNLTKEDCVHRMLELNKVFPSESANKASNGEIITSEFMCEGVEVGNENYTSVLLNNNTLLTEHKTLLNSNNK